MQRMQLHCYVGLLDHLGFAAAAKQAISLGKRHDHFLQYVLYVASYLFKFNYSFIISQTPST